MWRQRLAKIITGFLSLLLLFLPGLVVGLIGVALLVLFIIGGLLTSPRATIRAIKELPKMEPLGSRSEKRRDE
jgi:uncharacterized protein YneF (UPF0154 family)